MNNKIHNTKIQEYCTTKNRLRWANCTEPVKVLVSHSVVPLKGESKYRSTDFVFFIF